MDPVKFYARKRWREARTGAERRVEVLSRLLKVRSIVESIGARKSGKGTRNRKSHADGVHRRISSRGFLRGSFRMFMGRVSGRYQYSSSREKPV